MTNEIEQLARRAVACPRWRWMPGMLLAGETPNARPLRVPDGGDPTPPSHWGALPDLADPATLGCLLALVREAWGRPLVCTFAGGDGQWAMHGMATGWEPWHPTEAAALVAALEAAPAPVAP